MVGIVRLVTLKGIEDVIGLLSYPPFRNVTVDALVSRFPFQLTLPERYVISGVIVHGCDDDSLGWVKTFSVTSDYNDYPQEIVSISVRFTLIKI